MVQKVYEWSSCPFAKMIPQCDNQFSKRTARSLIYFLNYAYLEIWPRVLFFSPSNFELLPIGKKSNTRTVQFCLTRNSKYEFIGTDRNTICQYFALVWLYQTLLFIMSIDKKGSLSWQKLTQMFQVQILVYQIQSGWFFEEFVAFLLLRMHELYAFF